MKDPQEKYFAEMETMLCPKAEFRASEALRQRIMDEAKAETTKHRARIRRIAFTTAACLAVAFLGGLHFLRPTAEDTSRPQQASTQEIVQGSTTKPIAESEDQVFAVAVEQAESEATFVHTRNSGQDMYETVFVAELESINVRPDYTLDAVNITAEPEGVAYESQAERMQELHYIDPARYKTEGVQLDEIQIRSN